MCGTTPEVGGPLATFWTAVRDTDGDAEDESGLAGVREGHLGELAREAGLTDIEESRLTVGVDYPSFEEWWTPYTLGVGPAGAYVGGLDEAAAGGTARTLRRAAARRTVHGVRRPPGASAAGADPSGDLTHPPPRRWDRPATVSPDRPPSDDEEPTL